MCAPLAVALGEVAVAAHRVHEVVGDVDAVERLLEAVAGEDVALEDLGALDRVALAGERADLVAGGEQRRDQAAADVAGGAR